MPGSDELNQRALAYIATCTDSAKLRRLEQNAAWTGAAEVRRAARERFYVVAPAERPGTLEHEVWQSVLALEDVLTDEAGASRRLSRTRQKIGRDGEHKTVSDLIMGKPSAGFAMLVARDMTSYTFEAVALRFPDRFDTSVLAAAKQRLDMITTSAETG